MAVLICEERGETEEVSEARNLGRAGGFGE